MKTSTLAQREAPFADVAALIEDEKAAALAALDPQAFDAALLSRLGEQPRPRWLGSPRLAAACSLAVLLVGWVVWVPGPKATRGALDLRVVERALRHATAQREAGAAPTSVGRVLPDDVWAIERALLTWRRRHGGSVDLERALCFAAAASGGSRSCPSYEVRDAAAPGARRRLERTLIELERDDTIHRALVDRRRT